MWFRWAQHLWLLSLDIEAIFIWESVRKVVFCFPTPSLPKLGCPGTCSVNRPWAQRSVWLCLLNAGIKGVYQAGQWWCMPLIPVLGRQRQADYWVWSQPGLQSEFQESQRYTEKPCLKKKKKKKKTNQKNKRKKNKTKKKNPKIENTYFIKKE